MHDEGLKLRAALIGLNTSLRSRPYQKLHGSMRPSARAARAVGPNPEPAGRKAPFRGGPWLGLAALLVALVSCASRRSLPPLPPVDLSAPGWRVQQGQALWKPTKTRPELAGELLLATNANGNFLVQFVKTPFPVATAQKVGDQWLIDLGTGDYRRRGHGPPPARFVWFQLPTALAGGRVSGDWHFERAISNSWRLGNHRTGEALEGGFFP